VIGSFWSKTNAIG